MIPQARRDLRPRPLTRPQQRVLAVWVERVGPEGCSTFSAVFEPELAAADARECARLIGLVKRLIRAGALVASDTRRPEGLCRYRAA